MATIQTRLQRSQLQVKQLKGSRDFYFKKYIEIVKLLNNKLSKNDPNYINPF